jgi:hypothetical protein
MKLRHLFAGLLLILELPVVLPLAAGTLVTGLLYGVATLCAQARRIVVGEPKPLRGAAGDLAARPALES